MELSRHILKEFADVSRGVEREDKTQYLRGTIKSSGEAKYVRIDGSESLTPISEIVDVKDGDRVLVTIENHEATILGNLTKPPSAYKEQEAIDKAENAQGTAGEAVEKAENAESLAQSSGNKADAALVDATNASAAANQAKQDAAEAITAAGNASKNSTEAKQLATAAGQNAETARQEAALAQNAATAAQGEVTRIKGIVTDVKGDINTALEEVANQAADLQATKETLEVTYAKKTEVSDVQASLSTEISKKVGELQTTVAQTYAAKNDVVAMEGRLQTQITQTAGEVTSVVGKVEQLESDTTEAQKKVDDALEKSAAAQVAANQAQANATASQAAADAAKANADTATQKANEAAQNAATAAATAAEADRKVSAAKTDLDEAKENLANTINRVGVTEQEIAAAQQKVDAAQAAVTQAQKDAAEATLAANNAQTAADKAQTDATEAQNAATNAQKKADNAAIAADNAQAAANKAQQDVAALTKRVVSAETSITQNSEQIKLSATKTEEIGNRLDNLQVGGTNLIKNTSSQLQHVQPTTWHEFASIGSNKDVFNLADYLGKRLTLRVWIQNPSADSILQLYFNAPGWKAGNTIKAGQSGYSQLTVDVPTALPSFWNLVVGDGNGARFDYKELKAEIGDFATSWSPHPEDQQAQIDSLNSNIANNYYQKTTVDSKLSTAVSGITAQYTQDINTKLGNYYDKSTIDSKLTIDGQGIASYVKSTQSKLDNLQVGGTNLIKNTSSQLQHVQPTTWHEFASIGSNKDVFNLADYLGKRLTLRVWIQNPSADSILQLYFNAPGWKAGNTIKAGQSGYSQLTVDVPTALPSFWNLVVGDGNGARFDYKELKAEIGDFATSWSPHPEDMATLTQYTEVKQLADRISSTVYDSSTGLTTKVNQLANKYAITALNSAGDILASLNLNANTSTAEIDAKLIRLNGYTKMDDAFVNKLVANSILTNKIKSTEISGDYIKGGTIDGTIINSTGPNGTTKLIDGWFISTQNNAVGHYGAQSVDMRISDSSGKYAGSTKLTYNGFLNEMKNKDGVFAKRKITFHAEGFKIEPEDTNVGTNLNSGVHLVGRKAYLDFVANTIHRNDATPYYLRIIANEDGKSFIESTRGRLEIYTKNQEQLVVNNNYIPQTTSMDNNMAVKQMVVAKPNESGTYLEIRNLAGKTFGITMWQSDKRLKSNITSPTQDALDTLNQLQVRQFDWKSDNVHEDFGLVAQEVEQILPNAVFKAGDYYQIKDSGLIPVLIGAVQKLSNKVNLLENIIYNTKGSNLI